MPPLWIMTPLPISGLQLAILIFAIGLLGVPSAMGLASRLSLPSEDAAYLSQLISMSFELTIIAAVPALRVRARELVAVPLSRRDWPQVAMLGAAVIVAQFALFGAYALSRWLNGGDAAVAAMMPNPARGAELAYATATLRNLAITTLLAPVAEELVFRGFLFQAWSQRHRALTAMLLTSAVFAFCHTTFIFPFALGLLLNSLYVRTRSLRATMLVHFVANAAFWYPLLGQFIFPRSNIGLASWRLHLACLATFAVFTVSYAIFAALSPRERAPGDGLPVPAA